MHWAPPTPSLTPPFPRHCFTCAQRSSIFVMAAVVLAPAQMEAVAETGLGTGAAYVVQQHGASAIAKMTKARGA